MNNDYNLVSRSLVSSRAGLGQPCTESDKPAEEGGCGVTGFMASVPVAGRHIFAPSVQMHNRGNGKGGGIAAVGLAAGDLGVSQDVLASHYLLQVALVDPTTRPEVEADFIAPNFDIAKAAPVPTVDDYRDVPGLEVEPPDVMRYFVRVKPAVLARFAEEHHLTRLAPRQVEDEFTLQNSFRLNARFYSSLKEKRAFVLSHGRNMMILKIIGYAEQVVSYYRLEGFKAHGWIAHQRYPTKGRIWHPGGSHPFIGLNEALVHNGDFANYHAITEYLRQFNLFPQFLTDTEVAVLLFDLLHRQFGYPLEAIIEALGPTSEYDFDRLPPAKQELYRRIQATHVATSPDGPWFFIIARNNVEEDSLQLLGITDTAMLRPQVFALAEGEVQIGLICSEKQALDATLASLHNEDARFCPVADRYWNARGGSASDGGAFIFTVKDDGRGGKALTCTNKFGEVVRTDKEQQPCRLADLQQPPDPGIEAALQQGTDALKAYCLANMAPWSYASVSYLGQELARLAQTSDEGKAQAIEVLTYLNDRRYGTGAKKRAWVLHLIRESLRQALGAMPRLSEKAGSRYACVDWASRRDLRAPAGREAVLVLNAHDFPPEGEECDARLIVAAYRLGWRDFLCYGYKGQRFTGCGLGPDTAGVRLDVYDSSGDYLASGIDGLEIYVHGNAQDQLGQIMKRGKLVVYGDVGQTFLYGAKGGEVYVLGNAAGRPLINAVGKPRVVVNGTALDYLAESFMAGDPLQGGGFVILNGVALDGEGKVTELPTPYPGSNLFSLASGGAIYVRDPHRRLVAEQLNGGVFAELTEADWALLLPYLQENERLFGVGVADLLTVNGAKQGFAQVYRKIQPKSAAAKAVPPAQVAAPATVH